MYLGAASSFINIKSYPYPFFFPLESLEQFTFLVFKWSQIIIPVELLK